VIINAKMFGKKHEEKKEAQLQQAQLQQDQLSGANVQRQTNPAALGQEKIHHQENVHLQDVVHRDVETTEVKQVIQPVHETQVNPTAVREQVLPGKNLEINNDRGVAPIPIPQAQRTEDKTTTGTQHAPIIEERLHHKVIEQVQPVVSRDVIQPHQVHVKQPIHEHIVEAPNVTQTTAPVIEVTTKGQQPLGLQTGQQQMGLQAGQQTGLQGKNLGQGTQTSGALGQAK